MRNSIKIRNEIKALQDKQRGLEPNDEAGMALIQGQIMQLENELDAVLENEAAAREGAPAPASAPTNIVGVVGMQNNVDYPIYNIAESDSNGEQLVGEEWAATYEKARLIGNPLANLVRRIKTKSTHNIPFLIGSAAAVIKGENVAYAKGDPSLSSVILGAYKYTLTTSVSEELEADSLYNVDALLADTFGMAYGAAEYKAIIAGTGTDEPTGVLSRTADVTLAAKSSITYKELVKIVHKVKQAYRSGCVWVMNDATLAEIAGLVDGNNRPIWSDPVNGEPGKLLGYPVYESDDMDALGTASKSVIAFFNPNFVVLGERGPLTVKKLIQEYGKDYASNARLDVKLAPVAAFSVAKSGSADA